MQRESIYDKMTRCEKEVAKVLKGLGIKWSYEKPVFVWDENKRLRVWAPDFYLIPFGYILRFAAQKILIMTVNPGFYGSPFLPEMLDKIKELRDLKPDLDIEVDGGVTDKTIDLVNKAGANLFVSGSHIMKAENVKDSINKLKELIK